MAFTIKRIIDGKTYNTETATHLAGFDQDHGPYEYGEHLYQNRLGVFFVAKYRSAGDEDDYARIEPLSPDLAQAWLEKNAGWRADLIEQLFGEMPEAGSAEVKYTLRMPESLRERLADRAKANAQSLNAWIIRCLESCAAEGAPQAPSSEPVGTSVKTR